MAVSLEAPSLPSPERLVAETTGALGDSVTVLPVLAALGALTPMAVAPALALFGAFQVVWGARYRLPMSVEPMKALAGLAIAGSLTVGEFAAAGLLAGAVLLVAGALGALDRVAAVVGEPVVRGVQLGVGLVLARAGVGLAAADPVVAAAAVGVVVMAAALGRVRASVLALVGAGAAWALVAGDPAVALPAFGLPALALTDTALEATAAQLAMTVGNAAVATSLLCADLYDADVSPDNLATSMGVTTLAAVPLGGVPMCHGSGGLAGKYAYGARTALANVVLGGLYVAAALVATGSVVAAFPTAVLGVLLVGVAAQLASASLASDRRWLTAGVGAASLAVGVGFAFIAGAAVHLLLARRASRASPST